MNNNENNNIMLIFHYQVWTEESTQVPKTENDSGVTLNRLIVALQ